MGLIINLLLFIPSIIAECRGGRGGGEEGPPFLALEAAALPPPERPQARLPLGSPAALSALKGRRAAGGGCSQGLSPSWAPPLGPLVLGEAMGAEPGQEGPFPRVPLFSC